MTDRLVRSVCTCEGVAVIFALVLTGRRAMATHTARDRRRQLGKALERATARLSYARVELLDGGACRLRLSSPLGPESLLEVSQEGVSVTTRSAGLDSPAGDSRIVDRLGVDLSESWIWDHVRCTSAEELARLLVKHMLRRLRDADPEPQLETAE